MNTPQVLPLAHAAAIGNRKVDAGEIHGGGYSSGSGNWLLYDGARLARSQDVVVVPVTHRLNVFGHLHLEELGGEKYAGSSNLGMLDIVAALEWVRDNIAQLGGDPSNVTISASRAAPVRWLRCSRCRPRKAYSIARSR